MNRFTIPLYKKSISFVPHLQVLIYSSLLESNISDSCALRSYRLNSNGITRWCTCILEYPHRDYFHSYQRGSTAFSVKMPSLASKEQKPPCISAISLMLFTPKPCSGRSLWGILSRKTTLPSYGFLI